MTPARGLAAFINPGAATLAEAADAVAALARADALGDVVSQAFIVTPGPLSLPLPPGWETVSEVSPVQACQWAFDAAAQADLPLLAITGNLRPAGEVVGALAEALALDPLFGAAVPRVASGQAGRVLSAPAWDGRTTTVPLRVLACEPEYRILIDVVAPVMLFRRELVGSLPFDAESWSSPPGALANFAIRARRAGFRAVLCNRAIVGAGPDAPEQEMDGRDRRALRRAFPELARVNATLAGPDLRRAEGPLTAAFEVPDTLLLDARNLAAVFNGTSAAILGMADALYRARPDKGVTLWLHEDVAAWHGLHERYPSWRFHVAATLPPPHAAGLRLSQPWHVSEIESLSAAAAVNMYWMLDTIAWDIVYTAPDGLDQVWTRLAAEADAILFISEFSRRRFVNRFGGPPGLRTGVCRLSLAPADYTGATGSGGPDGPYWLVVGNQYDHKHIGPTVDLLTRAFPRQRLVVFGDRDQVRTSLVTRFDSGPVDEATVLACFAGADLVVFPSFYEGFGLPMIQGLSHGRTVVVRASALVDELAALYRGPGRLLTYATDRELVDLLNQWSHGEVPDGVPLGTDASASAWTWDAAAATMLETTRDLVVRCPSTRMLARTGIGAHGLVHPLRRPSSPDPAERSLHLR